MNKREKMMEKKSFISVTVQKQEKRKTLSLKIEGKGS